MRLIDADALKSKIREQPWKQETKVSLMLDWIYMLIDEASTVSTVQNKSLQQENEQLRAQVARMKEALELCSWYGSEGLCIDEKLARKIMKALRPDSGTDYHNPTKNEVIEINEQTTTKVKYP